MSGAVWGRLGGGLRAEVQQRVSSKLVWVGLMAGCEAGAMDPC